DLRAARQARGGGDGGRVHAAAQGFHAGLGRDVRGSRVCRPLRQASDVDNTILAVWRIEQPRLITGLSRMLRDVTLAEEFCQEALLAAIEHWPTSGIPEKPGAWLMATAKRRALDHLR